jgi:hypothetical protein
MTMRSVAVHAKHPCEIAPIRDCATEAVVIRVDYLELRKRAPRWNSSSKQVQINVTVVLSAHSAMNAYIPIRFVDDH